MISSRPSWLQEFGVIGSSVDINVSTCRFNAHVQRKGGVQGICAMRKALSAHERDGAQLRERRLEDYFRQQNERIAELERRLGQAEVEVTRSTLSANFGKLQPTSPAKVHPQGEG